MSDDVTIGEVFRLVESLKDEHGDKLDAIEQQVRITNGRTTRLEERVDVLNREMRDIKKAPAPVVLPEGESLSIKVSPKMWALIASVVTGLSIFAPMVQRWIEGLFKP